MSNHVHTTTIELDRRVAEALAAAAAARGLSLEDFLRDVGGQPAQGQVPDDTGRDDFDQWLDELAAEPGARASLPADFSRAHVYDDHD